MTSPTRSNHLTQALSFDWSASPYIVCKVTLLPVRDTLHRDRFQPRSMKKEKKYSIYLYTISVHIQSEWKFHGLSWVRRAERELIRDFTHRRQGKSLLRGLGGVVGSEHIRFWHWVGALCLTRNRSSLFGMAREFLSSVGLLRLLR